MTAPPAERLGVDREVATWLAESLTVPGSGAG